MSFLDNVVKVGRAVGESAQKKAEMNRVRRERLNEIHDDLSERSNKDLVKIAKGGDGLLGAIFGPSSEEKAVARKIIKQRRGY